MNKVNYKELTTTISTISQGQFHNLDELMDMLRIERPSFHWRFKSRKWYQYLPKFLQKRAEKYGLFALLLLSFGWISVLLFIGGLIPVMIIDVINPNFEEMYPLLTNLAGASILGGFMSSIFCFMTYFDETEKAEEIHEITKNPEKKKELIINHCRDMIDDHRNKVIGENSAVIKTENRLRKDIEEVDILIEELEDLLTGPDHVFTKSEEIHLKEQLEQAQKIKQERESILKAHQKGKQQFLDYFKQLEKKLSRVDTHIALKRATQKLVQLQIETEERIAESEKVFMDLITSFVGDAQRLQKVVENLQVFSQASFEVEADSSKPLLINENQERIDLDQFFSETIPQVEVEIEMAKV